MGRYLRAYKLIEPAEAVVQKITAYLQSEGYEYLLYENEYVFKKGKGIMTAPSFFKITAQGDMLRLEAWLKFAALPGVYIGELSLHGFYGFAMKKYIRGRAEHIENYIIRTAPVVANNSFKPLATTMQPMQPQNAGYTQPMQPMQPQNTGYAQHVQPQYTGYAQPAQPENSAPAQNRFIRPGDSL